LALRAVIFDYGMVLTGAPDAEAHDAMVRITGLPVERFESFYWQDRHAYDEGKLSGIAFWQKFLRDARIEGDQSKVDELNGLDARMWTTQNPAMVAWQKRLKQRGILTAILSNMGDSVLESIEREFAWIKGFDVLVWSYQLHIAKPDPKIYLHTLQKLGVQPEEALFLDDRRVNIEAALALGMKAIEFSTVDRLRNDLVAAGLGSELLLP
jgi:putative hydrolase of the HAD superfamily